MRKTQRNALYFFEWLNITPSSLLLEEGRIKEQKYNYKNKLKLCTANIPQKKSLLVVTGP